ncbi:hypothetical protein [Streptomyces acidiscabies]|uniref:hypothetical protein n=1 Tax=Streptomyces acidiscabies TaxID=42234 RepID=UPI0038F6B4A0
MKNERAASKRLFATVAVLLPLTACTITAEPVPGASPVASRDTASPVPPSENGAVTAYKAMWGDLVVAARESDAAHARLDDHAESGALQLLRHMMRENREQGLVVKGTPKFSPVIKKTDSLAVVIQDCADGTHWLQHTRDGALKDHVPGGHHRVDATVRRHGATWMVASLYIDEVGTCVE